MENNITILLDKVASSLESKGLMKEASALDVIANTIEAADIHDKGESYAQKKLLNSLGKNKTFNDIKKDDFKKAYKEEIEDILKKSKVDSGNLKEKIDGLMSSSEKTSDTLKVLKDALGTLVKKVKEKSYHVVDGEKGTDYGWMSPEVFSEKDKKDTNKDYMVKDTKEREVEKPVDLPEWLVKDLSDSLRSYGNHIRSLDKRSKSTSHSDNTNKGKVDELSF